MKPNSSEHKLEGGSAPIRGGSNGDDEFWLQMSRQAWSQGDDWFNTGLRPRMERNLAHFKSRHEPGSKYHSEAFKKRSRMFRPVTRKAIRRFVAACGRAFFSTTDILHCEPADHNNPQNVLAAEIQQALLNWRLNNSLPWWEIVTAAANEVGIQGVVISKEVWEHESEVIEQATPDMTGGSLQMSSELSTQVAVDRPMTRLVPLENIRISPASDWLEPMRSTPFIIEQVPYFLGELRERMSVPNSKIPYRYDLEDSELLQGKEADFDSIRAKREDSRDRFAEVFGGNNSDFDIVWVRECIVRVQGMDIYYETVGDNLMISDPVPLSRVHKVGRPYVMGRLDAEPHVLYPDGMADLATGLQREANEISNTRLDNVKLAMTGRWIVGRGKQTDIRSLMRNVPGSVTYSQSPNDVRAERPADVTSSAYQEQDRINLDLDDILGSFSQASVQGNRAMNETVGGMQMLNDGASELTEYMVRCFAESWYQQSLRLKARLCKAYESDETIMRVVGNNFNQDAMSVFRLIQEPTTVSINVAFGMTNPMKRIERLSMATNAVMAYFPDMVAKMDAKEVVKEIYGAVGYKDGGRFFPHLMGEDDPRIAQFESQIQQLQAALEGEQAKEQGKIQIAQINAQSRERIEQMRAQNKFVTEQLKAQLKQIDQALDQEQNEIKKRELYMQREALSHTIDNENRRLAMEEQRFRTEQQQPAPGTTSLIEGLRSPSSGTPIEAASTTAPSGGQGMAGVISRGEYGAIPGKRDFMEG